MPRCGYPFSFTIPPFVLERVYTGKERFIRVVADMERSHRYVVFEIAQANGVSKGYVSRIFREFFLKKGLSEREGELFDMCVKAIGTPSERYAFEILKILPAPSSPERLRAFFALPYERLPLKHKLNRVLMGMGMGRVSPGHAVKMAETIKCEALRKGKKMYIPFSSLLKMNALMLMGRHREVVEVYEEEISQYDFGSLNPVVLINALGILSLSAPNAGNMGVVKRLVRAVGRRRFTNPYLERVRVKALVNALINLGYIRDAHGVLRRTRLDYGDRKVHEAAVLSSLLRAELLRHNPEVDNDMERFWIRHYKVMLKMCLGMPVSEAEFEETYPGRFREGIFLQAYLVARCTFAAYRGEDPRSYLMDISEQPTDSIYRRIVRAVLTGKVGGLRDNPRENVARLWIRGRLEEAVSTAKEYGLLLHLNFMAAVYPYRFSRLYGFRDVINVLRFSLPHRVKFYHSRKEVWIDGRTVKFKSERNYRDAVALLTENASLSTSTVRYLRRRLGNVFLVKGGRVYPRVDVG